MPTVAAPLLQRQQRRHQLEEKNAYRHEPRLAQRASEGPIMNGRLAHDQKKIGLAQDQKKIGCIHGCGA
jgi:hypothetical protein